MTTYIGFRVEIVSRIVKKDTGLIVSTYNANGDSRIFDLFTDGKITVERDKSMLIARGAKEHRKNKRQGAAMNFSLMVPIGEKELPRIVEIVNVLGNGRLIRERVKTFIDRGSTLNNLPELSGMITAFQELETYIPGFINGGWYYAPEAKF